MEALSAILTAAEGKKKQNREERPSPAKGVSVLGGRGREERSRKESEEGRFAHAGARNSEKKRERRKLEEGREESHCSMRILKRR